MDAKPPKTTALTRQGRWDRGMAANGNKKHGVTKRKASQVRYTAERRWESNKRRRIEREAARQSACKSVRSLARNAGETIVKDVSRRLRIARRAA